MKHQIIHTTGILIWLLVVAGTTNLPAATITNEIQEMNEINEMNETNQPDSIIAAKELYDAFKRDEAGATKKYGKQIITIKGYAVFVGPDVYALPSVELSEKKGGKSRILCVLPFSDYLKLRKVSKGDEITFTGEVRGYYEKGDQVVLKQCQIVETIK
ncbi:MAG: OB-fold putative lipoprotein [Tannerellaceae bacterium]|nr:OB-fold putative lipoprotein [Tannerellaceae bacterium]